MSTIRDALAGTEAGSGSFEPSADAALVDDAYGDSGTSPPEQTPSLSRSRRHSGGSAPGEMARKHSGAGVPGFRPRGFYPHLSESLPQLATPEEVAPLLNMNALGVVRQCRAGKLPGVKFAGRWLVHVGKLKEQIDAACS